MALLHSSDKGLVLMWLDRDDTLAVVAAGNNQPLLSCSIGLVEYHRSVSLTQIECFAYLAMPFAGGGSSAMGTQLSQFVSIAGAGPRAEHPECYVHPTEPRGQSLKQTILRR